MWILRTSGKCNMPVNVSLILFGLIPGIWSSHCFIGSSLARGMWMVSLLTAVLGPGCAVTQTLQMSTHWGEWQNIKSFGACKWGNAWQCFQMGNPFENSHYSCSFVTPVGQTLNISPLIDRCTLLIVHSYFRWLCSCWFVLFFLADFRSWTWAQRPFSIWTHPKNSYGLMQ